MRNLRKAIALVAVIGTLAVPAYAQYGMGMGGMGMGDMGMGYR